MCVVFFSSNKDAPRYTHTHSQDRGAICRPYKCHRMCALCVGMSALCSVCTDFDEQHNVRAMEEENLNFLNISPSPSCQTVYVFNR